MTVGPIAQPVQYPGNGSATIFNFPGLITATSDLIVGFIVSGVYTQQVGTYSIPSAGIGNVGGCQVVFGTAPPVGTTVDLRSLLPETQPTNFGNLGTYSPESNTAAVDRTVRLIQDLYRLTYLFGIHGADIESVPWAALPPPSQRLGMSLVFDPVAGLPTVGQPTSSVVTQALLAGLLGQTQTAAEAAAFVTPSNTNYPVGNVKRYGATGNGATDDSAAINAAFAVANQIGALISKGTNNFQDFFPSNPVDVYFPPGDYVYNGSGYTASSWCGQLIGASKNTTRVIVASGVVLLTITGVANNTVPFAGIKNLHLSGGAGYFQCTGSVANTMGQFVFEDCIYFNYSGCAIGRLFTDGPHWKIWRNQFHGALSSAGERQSFGVVYMGLSDGCEIEHNEFQENLVHVKAVTSGAPKGGINAANIRENIFERWTTSPGSNPSVDVWLVPSVDAPTASGGVGYATLIEGNRFGNENLLTTDYHVLIADENTTSGTSSLNYLPKLTSVSTAFIGGTQFIHNTIFGTGASSRAFVFSQTPNIWGCRFRDYTIGTPISELDFYAGSLTDTNNAQNTTNTLEQMHLGAPSYLMTAPSTSYNGPIKDELSIYQNYPHVPAYWRAGFDPSYLELTTQAVTAFTTGNFANLTGVAITGTSGQFSCSAASITLVVNQQLTIAGTLGGSGSITGYTNPTTYLISATNGSTTFTLTTLTGGALTTTAGTPTGVTYTVGQAALSQITDSCGGNEAVQVISGGINNYIVTTITTPTTGRLGFVSFDIQQGASNPIGSVQVTLTDNSGQNNAVLGRFIDPITIGSQWRRVTIPFCVVEGAATISTLTFYTPGFGSGATTFNIGRVRCFHSQEPVHPGTRYLDSGLIAYTGGAITNGSTVTQAVTVTGAAAGDMALCGFTGDASLAATVTRTQRVTAANTVSVSFTNNSGGTLTPSGNLRVRVFKAI
jgi:hypothetical protein